MRRLVSVLLCVLLCCVFVFGAVPGAAQPDAEETRLEAQLESDGDARWTITASLSLEDEEDVEQFEAFAEEFESGDATYDIGVSAFERAAAEASTASGREMSVHSTSREAVVVNETDDGNERARGELRVSFTWESFARVDDNGTMYVDDAFNTTDGTWLPGLDADQTLVIHAAPGYTGPTTSPVGADGGTLEWNGPQTFDPGYFVIVYQPGAEAPAGLDLPTILLVGALVLSGAALLLGLYLLFRRRERDPTPDPTVPTPSPDEGGSESADSLDGLAATDGDGSDDGVVSEVNLELLSDEERVEHLLERNGGRMKQATIVKETDWSNAKVSQLLSSMDDENRINKLRIGRENLISLPEHDLTEFTEE